MQENAVPPWDGMIEKWSTTFVKKNIWRVHGVYDLEDLLADARLKYEQCCVRYRDRVRNPAHFMALFKRSLTNHFNTLSLKVGFEVRECDLKTPREEVYDEERPYYDVFGGSDRNFGELAVLVSEAPYEARILLEALYDDTKASDLRQEHMQYKTGTLKLSAGGLYARESTDGFYARVLGLPAEARPASALRKLLDGSG